MKKRNQQGVALVITLILLSVITFMAVTFLVVSRHEGAQVDTIAQQTAAKNAADAAIEEAKAQIVANMLATGNGLNFGLVVSTNYINANGFQTGMTNLLNINYNYPDGRPLTLADAQILQNNLLILPRAPVFVATNSNKNLPPDFRYYLDLNRNGVYDTNGAVFESDDLTTHIYTGDPEWVGILNRPDQRHSSSNFFLERYCFFAVPIGNSLDVNYIHNQSLQNRYVAGLEGGYLRNEGVGSWEINLAAFLQALNTNIWNSPQYSYNWRNPSFSTGVAFDDAAAIVQGRYGGSYASGMSSFTALYPVNPTLPSIIPATIFRSDQIDGYGVGPLMTNVLLPFSSSSVNGDPDYNLVAARPWSGSPNPSTYFSTQDLFNKVPSPAGSPLLSFTNRLNTAGRSYHTGLGSSVDSYNRYTFYRMLAQLGTDSAPEPTPYPYTNKINLNYNNLTNVYSQASGNSAAAATNFVPWTAIAFFTNAADRMLRMTFPNPVPINTTTGAVLTSISITNIPIYPTNYYTASIQRILQLAANIYDASNFKVTNAATDIDFPSVFRPVFDNSRGVIRISGYVEVGPTTTDLSYLVAPTSLQDIPTNQAQAGPYISSFRSSSKINVYGIPWIIGAKKGFPNFNQFVLMNASTVTRKLQFTYNSSANPPMTTNVQYVIGVSNAVALQTWNSYQTSPYANRSMQLYGFNSMSMVLSNETGVVTNSPVYFTNYVGLSSGGSTNPLSWNFPIALPANAIVLPLSNSFQLVPNLVYHPGQAFPLSSSTIFDPTGNNQQRIFPQLILNATNRLQYVMIDNLTHRIIDYVHFDGMNFSRNLIGDLAPTNTSDVDVTFGGVWRTNFVNGAMQGIKTQIQLSEFGTSAPLQYGDTFPVNGWVYDALTIPRTILTAQTNFQTFLKTPTNTTAPVQAPFTPITQQVVSYAFQVNDPLVHYTLGDLSKLVQSGFGLSNSSYLKTKALEPTGVFDPNYMLGIKLVKNNGKYGRYAPWGIAGDTNIYNMAVKDPQVRGSDSWQFPTNKFPNIGWLGRVHRGTPWQTVFLKPTTIDPLAWAIWTGNPTTNYFRNAFTGTNGNGSTGVTTPGYPGVYDAVITMPTNDWALLDLFTTAPNENASRGQLSVNQTNLASWAAVLDGVIALTNTSSTQLDPFVIDPTNTMVPPGRVSPVNTVQYIVNSINSVRTNFPNTNSGTGAFSSVGQLLSVPQLTTASPFINWTNTATNALTDAVVERIPQQILSLLRVGSPRYVIYAYGQSLKPANNSIVQSGQYFGMCTNYQITGEVATRTVIRIDNYPTPGVANASGYHPHAVVESFNVLPPE